MQIHKLRYDAESGWSGEFPDLDSPDTMVLVFGASRYLEKPDAIVELRRRLPRSVLTGCSTSGEVFADSMIVDHGEAIVGRVWVKRQNVNDVEYVCEVLTVKTVQCLQWCRPALNQRIAICNQQDGFFIDTIECRRRVTPVSIFFKQIGDAIDDPAGAFVTVQRSQVIGECVCPRYGAFAHRRIPSS